MNPVVILLCAVVGLFSGGFVWTLARNQASRWRLIGNGLCADEVSHRGRKAWLPLRAFGSGYGCALPDSASEARRLPFELIVAAYFAVAAWRIDDGLNLLAVLAFSIPLLVVLLVDAWTRLIHTNVIGVGLALGLLFAAADGWHALGSSALAIVIAALVFGGIFMMAVVIYRNPKVVPFGLGDVYLASMIGSMVRLGDLMPALLYGIFLAGITVMVLLVLKKVDRKQAVAYGPYLVAGAMLVMIR